MENLLAAQDFVTRWLYRYDDEFFGLLYDDTTNLAHSLALFILISNSDANYSITL
ncbi:MAG: hypothetical protein ACREAR_03975 [Nitrosotalea sp.]